MSDADRTRAVASLRDDLWASGWKAKRTGMDQSLSWYQTASAQ